MVGPFTVPAMSCSRQLWQQSSAAVLRSCSQACSTSAPSTDLPSSSAHLLSFARSIWYHSGRRDRLAESVPYMRARAKWKKQLKQLREQYKAEIMQKYPDPKVARKAQQQEMVTMVEERIKVAQELRRQRQERLDFKLATAQMQLQIAEIKLRNALETTKRNEVLKLKEEWRRQLLLQQSRFWVTPETLEARVMHALDNPQPFPFVQPGKDAADGVYDAYEAAAYEGGADGGPMADDAAPGDAAAAVQQLQDDDDLSESLRELNEEAERSQSASSGRQQPF